MVVMEIHTHGQPSAPLPPTEDGIQTTACFCVRGAWPSWGEGNKEDGPGVVHLNGVFLRKGSRRHVFGRNAFLCLAYKKKKRKINER